MAVAIVVGAGASASEFSVQQQGADGVTRKVIVVEDILLGGRTASVTFKENGTTTLSAFVRVSSAGAIGVSGTLNGALPFGWTLSELVAGTVSTKYEYDRSAVQATITVGQPPSEQTANAFGTFRDAVDATNEHAIALRYGAFIEQVAVQLPEWAGIYATIAGRGAEGRIVTYGPIGDWLDCLQESCVESGGCWRTSPLVGCVICANTPWYFAVFIASAYDFSATLCTLALINPIR